MGAISNCGLNENGGTHGGKPGDQTGKEYELVKWYSRPWSHILRCPNQSVASKINAIAIAAPQNDNIGYDQGARHTMLKELEKVGWNPSKITTPCSADCSSSTSAVLIAAGNLAGDAKLAKLGLQSSSSIVGALKKLGWTDYTSSDYTKSDSKLQPGDVMVLPGAHVAIWTSASPGQTGGGPAIGGGGVSGGGGNGPGQVTGLGVGAYDYEDYTVQKGDTLESIANKFGSTVGLIMFINGLTSMELKPGDKLKVAMSKGTLDDPSAGTKPIIKKHSTGVAVSHPTIECIFFTEIGRLATVSTTGLTSATDMDNDIISVTTNRGMSQDCPTFTITLTWRRNWFKVLSSNDLLIINMQRPPEKKRTVMIGLIDDIRKTIDMSSGQPQRAVQVTGRGLNKALATLDVGLIENISIDTKTGFFAGFMELQSLNSYKAIEKVLENYIDKGLKYIFSDGTSFGDRYQYKGNEHEGEVLVDMTSYTQYNGSLWNFIKELSNTPWNETYWEIEDDKATLIHRRTPFNKEDWISLTRRLIPDHELVADNTGRSDLETYTMFSVHPTIMGDTLANVFMPLWYPPFVQKYGMTRLIATTSYQSWGTLSGNGMGEGTGEFGIDVNIKRDIMFHPSGKNSMKHLVIHTSCVPGASAENIAKAVKNRGLSVQGVIADWGVLQTAEWDSFCHHAGNVNKLACGFEQCEAREIKWNGNATVPRWNDGDANTIRNFHDKMYNNAVGIFAMLCNQYNIKPEDCISHLEAGKKYGGTDHADPEELWKHFEKRFGDSKWNMNAFRGNIKNALSRGSSGGGISGSGWISSHASCYGNTAGDDNGTNGWNGYKYHRLKGNGVAIPRYFVKQAPSLYKPQYVQKDCPSLAKGYGTIVEIYNPATKKKCTAICCDSGNFGPRQTYNKECLLDLQPNTQKALGINRATKLPIKFRVIGHWSKDFTHGNGPYTGGNR